MIGCRTLCRSRGLRNLFVAALLLSYLTTVIGVPVRAKDPLDDRPYPCQGHLCGCCCAEQCWRTCCCFTREQKLAWAVEHGVTPPREFFETADAPAPGLCPHCGQGNADPQSTERQSTDRACSEPQHSNLPCPDQPCAACGTRSARQTAAKRARPPSWLQGISARACQGLPILWVTLGAVLPLAPRDEHATPLVAALAISRSTWLAREAAAPPIPPPRAA
ncbi:MAG TPA: hypothetical protein VFE24_02490 [Pirellulales bacterium]|jgi:hypothetical protein|nr:hypothetical protein [Pirellulales bacterium]